MAAPAVPSEERIFSLVLALVASEHGLTKHELLSSVYGYSERYRSGTATVALDRQFERDKDQLRALGIPLETIETPGEPGNNQHTRYRVSKAALEVPEGLSFTDRELMLLRLAALAWREGSLTVEARRASMKLESLGAGVDAPTLGVSLDFGTAEPAAPALLAAIEAGEVARFEYQLPGRQSPLERRVLPLRLHRFEGRWHVIARDLERDATRVFLLSRISGAVHREARNKDDGVEIDPEREIDTAIAELASLQQRQRAVVRVRRNSVAEAQLSRRAVSAVSAPDPTRQDLTIGTVDYRECAALIAGFGVDAIVLEPAELRLEVESLWERAFSAHSEVPHG